MTASLRARPLSESGETFTPPASAPSVAIVALRWLLLALVLGAYFYQFYLVWFYAVDVPYRDEWGLISPDGLPAGVTWHWLFRLMNEHRQFTAKLMVAALFAYDHWDLYLQQLLNYLIYGFLVLTVYHCLKSRKWSSPTSLLAWMLFLVSPIAFENHQMGLQVQVHFALLFTWLAAFLLFDESQSAGMLAGGLVCALLAIYSESGGLVSCAAVAACFGVFKLCRFWRSRQSGELVQLAAVGLPLLLGLVLWFVGYPRGGSVTSPVSAAYWNYFFNLLSGGLGIKSTSPIPGALMFVTVLLPAVTLVRQKRVGDLWPVLALTLGMVAILFSIAAGRTDFGVDQSKASRYTEYTVMLLPLAGTLWAVWLRQAGAWRPRMQMLLIVACALPCQSIFADYGSYAEQYGERSAGILCAKAYYEGRERGSCVVLCPGPMAHQLDVAQQLQLSFYRTLVEEGLKPVRHPVVPHDPPNN